MNIQDEPVSRPKLGPIPPEQQRRPMTEDEDGAVIRIKVGQFYSPTAPGAESVGRSLLAHCRHVINYRLSG